MSFEDVRNPIREMEPCSRPEMGLGSFNDMRHSTSAEELSVGVEGPQIDEEPPTNVAKKMEDFDIEIEEQTVSNSHLLQSKQKPAKQNGNDDNWANRYATPTQLLMSEGDASHQGNYSTDNLDSYDNEKFKGSNRRDDRHHDEDKHSTSRHRDDRGSNRRDDKGSSSRHSNNRSSNRRDDENDSRRRHRDDDRRSSRDRRRDDDKDRRGGRSRDDHDDRNGRNRKREEEKEPQKDLHTNSWTDFFKNGQFKPEIATMPDNSDGTKNISEVHDSLRQEEMASVPPIQSQPYFRAEMGSGSNDMRHLMSPGESRIMGDEGPQMGEGTPTDVAKEVIDLDSDVEEQTGSTSSLLQAQKNEIDEKSANHYVTPVQPLMSIDGNHHGNSSTDNYQNSDDRKSKGSNRRDDRHHDEDKHGSSRHRDDRGSNRRDDKNSSSRHSSNRSSHRRDDKKESYRDDRGSNRRDDKGSSSRHSNNGSSHRRDDDNDSRRRNRDDDRRSNRDRRRDDDDFGKDRRGGRSRDDHDDRDGRKRWRGEETEPQKDIKTNCWTEFFENGQFKIPIAIIPDNSAGNKNMSEVPDGLPQEENVSPIQS